MKPLLRFFFVALMALGACKNHPPAIVNTYFTDSLLIHYTESSFEKQMRNDLVFWKNRLDSNPGTYTAQVRYAGALTQRFHSYGNMMDLLKADSILNSLNIEYKEKEAGLLRSLASLNITRHRFRDAAVFVQKALDIGSEKYASTLLLFDTRFELGSYVLASQALQSCAASNEYGYFFRLAKWKHLQGETDSAGFYMQKAAGFAGTSLFLKQTAQSNLADLYLHEGELKKAHALYMDNLSKNASDFHSLLGLGRIMLLNDNNPDAAEKLFRFVGSKNQLPDAAYNLVWVAEQKQDSTLTKRYASDFVAKATNSVYGGMYNKYLVELYADVLADPSKALMIAKGEISNRATPQTYAWLVWALHKTGNDAQAWEVYRAHVSGKPLEALELYWMGRMMKETGRNYNATEFFKAANKNRFDLSPDKQRDLLSSL
ncbi:MAG: hypothetical protein V4450_02465 [Bacteroidota bacterium]